MNVTATHELLRRKGAPTTAQEAEKMVRSYGGGTAVQWLRFYMRTKDLVQAYLWTLRVSC